MALICLLLTAWCWARMDANWSMAVSEAQRGELIVDGLFARVRHPIYALSVMLMLCSAVIVATPPMLVIAVIHVVLMHLKARNEERHMLKMHGDAYAALSAAHRALRAAPRGAPGLIVVAPHCTSVRVVRRLLAAAASLAIATCGRTAAGAAVLPAVALPDGRATKIGSLALDPEHISAADVRESCRSRRHRASSTSRAAWRWVTMQPFAQFLVAMGYPEERLRNPPTARFRIRALPTARRLAGTLAWYYESEGMMPMLIGHSQGGMLVIRVLHELAGRFTSDRGVESASRRIGAAHVDHGPTRRPRASGRRPEGALCGGAGDRQVAALAAGAMDHARQIAVDSGLGRGIHRLHHTVGSDRRYVSGSEPYRATGTAEVRNVELPAGTSHIGLPDTQALASNAETRAWIESLSPGRSIAADRIVDGVETGQLVAAAEIWFSVKKHWCLEAQR